MPIVLEKYNTAPICNQTFASQKRLRFFQLGSFSWQEKFRIHDIRRIRGTGIVKSVASEIYTFQMSVRANWLKFEEVTAEISQERNLRVSSVRTSDFETFQETEEISGQVVLDKDTFSVPVSNSTLISCRLFLLSTVYDSKIINKFYFDKLLIISE